MKLKAIFKCRISRFITLWSLLCLLLSSHSMLVNAQDDNHSSLLMPKPQQITENGTSFTLNRNVNINDETHSTLLASLFNVDNEATATVTVNIVDAATLGTFDYNLPDFENEGYKLLVEADAITITAATKTGVIRAAQTLAQLAASTNGVSIPGVNITDYPAFKLRGLMHDVGRSFISFNELKKEIDLLSRFKVNVFHWHLTDNQGFRFESKLYPQLNQSSAMTRFAGSYYTQEQCTELEAYAAERGVTVIPEIDMPGHSKAFTTAMGYSMSSDEGKVVLKDLLNELATAFPLAPYIHMGADEAGTTAAFVNEMSQYIKETLHRRCIVWNPISGVNISTSTLPYVDMTEMWSTSGKKISGIPNIDCRYNYINHFDVFADLVGIYKSNIYYTDKGDSEVAGAITAIWNDRKTPSEEDIIEQNNLYANALATAERGWIGGGSQYIEQGGTTLPRSGSEYEEFADWERRFLHYKDTWLSEEPIPYVKQTNVKWRITQAFPNEGNADTAFPPETATEEILPDHYTYNGQTYTTSMATGAAIYLRHVWGTTVPTFYSNPVLNTTAYAWTYVYSPTAQTAGALIEFQNYGRSENDKAPDAGKWDRKGSRIWVNDTEVLPPTWTNTGVSINSEVDLRNENFPAREPVSINLKAGWNKVFLKLPYVNANGIRLNKWMFTFVLTDVSGRHALEGITYSPIQSLDEEEEAWNPTISEVYTMINTSGSNRGALIYEPSQSKTQVWSSYKSGATALNDANVNHQWVIIPTGTSEQYYLYNVGAGKFAIPTAIAQSASNAWVFSDNAVPVTFLEQANGTMRIKMAKDPVNGTNAAVIGINSNLTPPVFNYNDNGSDFIITKVDGADASAAAGAAVARLVKSQTKLTSYPQASGWYAIQINSKSGAASYSGRYLQATQTLYNNLYPLSFTGAVDVQPAINDPSFLTHIDYTSFDNNLWQLPDGRYLVGNDNDKFPTVSATPSAVTTGYQGGNFFKTANNYYADPYNSGANYFIGETVAFRSTYNVYPIDLAAAGLEAWKVSIANASPSTLLTCTRTDVTGLKAVYNNGYFFLPTGVTPVAANFTMEGMEGSPVINTETKTINVTYDPTISILPGNVEIILGNETTGKGNTMQALMRMKVTPFAACTPKQLNLNLYGANQIEKVTVYTTTIDQIHAPNANPKKVGEAVPQEGAMSVTLDGATALAAEQGIYLWLTADIKEDATEMAEIKASITSLEYDNAAGGNTCNLSSKGSFDGSMRIYKQQAFLWTGSKSNARYYRIPTIIRTDDGGILALTDDRYSSTSDLGNHKIDVVIRKSMDNGKTWSTPKAIAVGDGSSDAAYGYGDPAVVRTLSGKLICLMASGKNGYFSGMLHMGYVESTDNGETWTTPKGIFSNIEKNGISLESAFTTAGKGVTFSNGRVAFAMNGKVNGTTNDYILYSDDEGATWTLSPNAAFNGGDESKLEIMNDNSLLISVRRGGYNSMADRGHNRTKGDASGDGINQWKGSGTWSDLNANGCNGDLLYYGRETEGEPDMMLHTVVKNYVSHRLDLRLYISFDQGATWTEAIKLQPGYAAYSSMQKLENGDLAIIFEDGSIGNKDEHDCYAINYVVISKEMISDMYGFYRDQSNRKTDPNNFNATTTYLVKNEGNSKYISSKAEEETGYALVTENYDDAANFVMIPDATKSNYFYMYDIRSGNFLVPDNKGAYLNTGHWSWSSDPITVRVRNNTENNYKPTQMLYTFGNLRAANGVNGSRESGDYLANHRQSSPDLVINHWYVNRVTENACVEMTTISADVTAEIMENFITSAAAAGTPLQYTATVGEAGYETLVIPFEADLEEAGTEAYRLENVNDVLGIEMTQVTTIEANKPVLLKNSGSVVLKAKDGTTAYDAEPVNALLKGVYAKAEAPVGSYVLMEQDSETAFFKVADEAEKPSVNPFRAYLNATSDAVKLLPGGQGTNGINSLTPSPTDEGNYEVYDLQGRRVKSPLLTSPRGGTGNGLKPGLYIVNGRKVVIK